MENGKVATVEVNMGAPILEPKKIPVAVENNPVVDVPVEVKGKNLPYDMRIYGESSCDYLYG